MLSFTVSGERIEIEGVWGGRAADADAIGDRRERREAENTYVKLAIRKL